MNLHGLAHHLLSKYKILQLSFFNSVGSLPWIIWVANRNDLGPIATFLNERSVLGVCYVFLVTLICPNLDEKFWVAKRRNISFHKKYHSFFNKYFLSYYQQWLSPAPYKWKSILWSPTDLVFQFGFSLGVQFKGITQICISLWYFSLIFIICLVHSIIWDFSCELGL